MERADLCLSPMSLLLDLCIVISTFSYIYCCFYCFKLLIGFVTLKLTGNYFPFWFTNWFRNLNSPLSDSEFWVLNSSSMTCCIILFLISLRVCSSSICFSCLSTVYSSLWSIDMLSNFLRMSMFSIFGDGWWMMLLCSDASCTNIADCSTRL